MSAENLIKIKGRSAAEVVQSASLSKDVGALVAADAGAAQLLTVLLERELFVEAVSVLAHALPKREAVWWACLAARRHLDETTAPEVKAALEGAEAWVYSPTDATRRAAMEQAQKTQFDHPAVWAAVGAFWSGGSMVAPELPPVPPAEHLTGVAVAGAVKLSAVIRQPENAPKTYRALLAQGIDIAKGGSGRIEGA